MPDERNTAGKSHESQADPTSPFAAAVARPGSNPENPHSEEVHQKAHSDPKEPDKWFHNPDWYMVFLTLLLFGVGIYTAWVFHGQFKEMQTQTGILNTQAAQASADSSEAGKRVEKQLDLAQKQVRAAQDSVKAIQRQMRQDQRAWISYTVETLGPSGVPAVGQPFLIRFTFKNVGKSVATNVKMCIAEEFLTREKVPTFECPGPGKQSFDNGPIFPSAFTYGDLPAGSVLQTDRDRIMSGSWNVWVYGNVHYRDTFGVEHWFNLCNRLLSGGGYQVCQQHTEIDNNQ